MVSRIPLSTLHGRSREITLTVPLNSSSPNYQILNTLLNPRASRPTASLASIVNESETLQRLVDLGVNLHKWEVRGHMGMAVKLDFTEHVAPKIRFLADLGVHHHKVKKIKYDKQKFCF